MRLRLVPIVLLLLLLIVHAQLWMGRGSQTEVVQMRKQLAELKAANAVAQQANERLASEVNDLKEGLATVEEKARSELGMVKQGEIYVQIAR